MRLHLLKHYHRIVTLSLLILLAGCSSLPALNTPENLPQHAYIDGLTLYPDEQNYCGPATLATLFDYYQQPVNFDQLASQLVIPKKGGSLRVEMRAQARQNGLVPYPLTPKINSLLIEIAVGNPVIVMQNLGLAQTPQWHYAVVRGYDLDKKTITLVSGLEANYTMPLSLFRRTWARAKNWAIVPKPADTLAATVGFIPAMSSAYELEQVRLFKPAYITYTSIAGRWPNDAKAVVNMGLANTAFRLKEFATAKKHLLTRIEQFPDIPDSWNNLAHVLEQLQCPVATVAAAHCATKIAPNQPILESTHQSFSLLYGNDQASDNSACDIPQCPVD